MSVYTLQVDGKMVTGREGDSIFSVAWEHGIRIPRLCHVGGLSDVGACRLCMVEVEGQKRLQAGRHVVVSVHPLAHEEEITQTHLLAHAGTGPPADHHRLDLGHVAFLKFRKAVEQLFTTDQAQDGVA